ncbi:MAG TPA: hypothetical protein VFV34_05525 [Blastocatellia bacterium]|nr:hypothetical protein [Blastocatellia bacterium]
MKTAKGPSLVLVVALLPIPSAGAQSKSANASRSRLPVVGEIKDYPATGLTTGCPNYYFFFPEKAGSTSAMYVFLSRERGEDAWMNLDGNDTRLKLLKAERPRKVGAETEERYLYRAGPTEIGVQIKHSKGEQYEEFPLKMIITLRKGVLSRRIRAIGFADC